MAMMTVSYALLIVLMMLMMITQGFQGALRQSPVQFNIGSVENYDNVVAQYDKMLSLNEELAHIFFKMTLKSKDDTIKSKDDTIIQIEKKADAIAHSKDDTIKSKDDAIKSKDETITQIEKKADAIAHSKDEIIELNRSLLNEKDIRLKEKENQILGLQEVSLKTIWIFACQS